MELVTLQFGPYANFVGTHYWNSQDEQFKQDRFQKTGEINYDALGRATEGQVRSGATIQFEILFFLINKN